MLILRHVLVLVSLSALFACGGGVSTSGLVVGGPCGGQEDCDADSVCLTGGDFPGGTCAIRCSDHSQCPEGSWCVEKEGGVCLLGCEVPGDCRGGYDCKGRKAESNEGGESLVCVG